MKSKLKTFLIVLLFLIVVVFLVALFIMQYQNLNSYKKELFSKNIVNPDRIVYRNKDGECFEFEKGTDQYNNIKNIISESLDNYNTNGNTVSDDKIDEIHESSFIEFDYETVSKNYIIPLENSDENCIIKLADTGGTVVSYNLKNIDKIIDMADSQSEGQKSYKFEYSEMYSKNKFYYSSDIDTSQFETINYKIYQAKIEDIETYNLFQEVCNLEFDEEISDDVFEDNVLILTVAQVPGINVKVNIGNIKYTYEDTDEFDFKYSVHLLIVSKIVNTDCIYNTDLTDISNYSAYYDTQVDNLDENYFAIDLEEFYEEYLLSSATISYEQAEEIAEIGFEEAEKIAGAYDRNSQTYQEIQIKPNNFFTKKYYEADTLENYMVDVYAFTRTDEMGNGVTVYVDKKLGKIVGGTAFGD